MASMRELIWLSLEEAAAGIQARAFSSVELTEAALAQIEQFEPRFRAFITVDRKGAIAAASAADAELATSRSRGSLHGIPVSIKDCFLTKGLRTTAGSSIYEDWHPDQDATVVRRLREAGAVILGKNNMFELATGWGTTGHFPLATNPWNADHTPGGSSSGSAVAVATGMGWASIGTDGGGSIRMPAAYSGVTGLKPSYGSVSSAGTIPVGPSVSHVGVLARSVGDARVVLAVIAGHDPEDPNSVAPAPMGNPTRLESLDGIRVGVPRRYVDGGTTADGASAFGRALDVLGDSGATIEEFDVPLLETVATTWTTLVYAELAAFHEENLRTEPNAFGVELRQRLEAGLATTAIDYLRARDGQARLREAYIAATQHVDVIATPTAPGPPPSMRELTARRSDLQDVGQLARYTRPHNLTGFPAAAVPAGISADGLPLSLQLAGPPGRDDRVWSVASWYQSQTDWHRRHPSEFS